MKAEYWIFSIACLLICFCFCSSVVHTVTLFRRASTISNRSILCLAMQLSSRCSCSREPQCSLRKEWVYFKVNQLSLHNLHVKGFIFSHTFPFSRIQIWCVNGAIQVEHPEAIFSKAYFSKGNNGCFTGCVKKTNKQQQKNNFNIGMHSDIYQSIWLKLSMINTYYYTSTFWY